MSQSQLQPPPPPSVQRQTKEAEEKDAEFLALRMLNKRARVRLSPAPVPLDPLPGRAALFAVSNARALFAAATCAGSSFNLVLSPLADLRAAFSAPDTDGEIPFTPKHSLPLPGAPNTVTFANSDSRLIVSLAQGTVLIYDTDALLAGTATAPILPIDSPTGQSARQILPNPEGIPELVAILYDHDGSAGKQAVNVFDAQTLRPVASWACGGTPDTTPTAIAWSPKGKQLAIGLQSGHIVTFSPTDASKPKSCIPRPSSYPSQAILSASWLSNPDFHAICIPPGPLTPETEQNHLILSLDAKSKTATEVRLASPYMPFPGKRPPGAFSVILRNWDPAKFLLFIGDSTSSDIGLVGCLVESGHETWYNLSLEETSRPSAPLDKDMEDTVLVGLVLDLTGTESFTHKTVSGEDQVLPPPPVMLAYASDGTVLGWNVLNTEGKAYPGMVTAAASASATEPVEVEKSSSGDAMEATAETPASATKATSPFGQPSSGFAAFATQPSQSSFGQTAQPTSAFGQPSFGQTTQPTSAFGQPSFGQPANPSPFSGAASSTPAFGQSSFAQPTSSSTGSASGGGAFGAFASAGPVKFGQTFGSTSPSTTFTNNNNQPSSTSSTSPSSGSTGATSTTAAPALGMTTLEDPMSADSESTSAGGFGGLGGLSLGGGGGGNSNESAASKPGLFGLPPPSSTSSTSGSGDADNKSAFGGGGGGGGILKPAMGFGAFGGGGGSSAFGGGGGAFSGGGGAFSGGGGGGAFSGGAFSSANNPTPSGDANKPSASPSTTTTGASPAFGSTGFGTMKPSTTTPAFGQTSFGQTSFGKPAFGQSGFAAAAKPATTASAFGSGSTGAKTGTGAGAFSAFANAGPSAFSALAASATSGSGSGGKPVWAAAAATDKDSGSGSGVKKEEERGGEKGAGEKDAAREKGGENMKGGQAEETKGEEEERKATTLKREPSDETITPASLNLQEDARTPPSSLDEDDTPPATPHPTTSVKLESKSPSPSPPTSTSTSAPTSTPTPAPASSMFKSSAPPVTGGAFGNLVTSSYGFGSVQSGFGAFGGATKEGKPSPFFNPPKLPAKNYFGGAATSTTGGGETTKSAFGEGQTWTPPKSAFPTSTSPATLPPALAGSPSTPPSTSTSTTTTTTTTTTTPDKPAFGSTTPLGARPTVFGKPSFGSTTPPAAFGSTTPPAAFAEKTSTTTPTSAFSAFSGSSSPFGAFAQGGSGKKASFSELLKAKDGESPEANKDKDKEKTKIPVSVFSKPPSTPGTPSKDKEREEGSSDNEDTRSLASDEQFFIEGAEAEGVGEYDDVDSFLSDSFSEPSDGEGDGPRDSSLYYVEEEDEEEGEGEESEPPSSPLGSPGDAIKIPLPPGSPRSKSRSPTPKAGTPDIKLTAASPPESPERVDKGKGKEPQKQKEKSPSPSPLPSAAREASTTPPGSPARDSSPPPVAAPIPIPKPGAGSSPFGLGRPSTRPVRSSPLASAPISGDDGSDEDGESSEGPVKKSRSAPPDEKASTSTADAFSIKGKAASLSPSATPAPIAEEKESSKARPKTPPLLSQIPTPPGPAKTGSVFSAPLGGFGQPKGAGTSSGVATPPAGTGLPAKPATGSIFSKPLTVDAFSKPSPPASASPTTTTPAKPLFATPPGGFFGQQKPATPATPSPAGTGATGRAPPTIPPTTAGPFSLKPPTSTSTPAGAGSASPFGGIPPAVPKFGQVGKAGQASLGMGPPPVPASALASASASGGPFAKPTFSVTSSVAQQKPQQPQQPQQQQQQQKELSVEEGMQAECAYLFIHLAKELERLRVLAKEAKEKKTELYKPTIKGARTTADLGDPTKWDLGDVVEFGRIMQTLEKDIAELKELRASFARDIRELERNMLRATARKEEIVRFSKASTDAEFAKILKARTLSPEHLETQSQLRRQIRVTRDRIQQLEDHLQACKKRLNQLKAGKPALRAPTLDTINRTYRNIDAALDRQADEIEELTSRMSKLRIKPTPKLALQRSTSSKKVPHVPEDSFLAISQLQSSTNRDRKGPVTVTPNVAITTAAALNAERAAQKLKKALLRVRKEPLLNTKAVEADVPLEFKTPQKFLEGSVNGYGNPHNAAVANLPPLPPAFNLTSPSTPATPKWSVPPGFDRGTPESDHEGGGRPRGGKHHAPSVQLKKSPGAPAANTPPPPPGFSWGPIPSLNVNKSAEGSSAKGKGAPIGALPFSLSAMKK